MIRHYMFIKYIYEILRREVLEIRYEVSIFRKSVYDNYNKIIDHSYY
jgi:hypothetical protein